MLASARRWFLLLLLLAAATSLVATTPATAGTSSGFSVVLLPDTQFYSETFADTYLAQTEWIRARAAAERTRFVIHLGDIVDNATVEEEWKVADRAHRVLDGVVPYSVLPGNHDGAPGETELYNKYFPPRRFEHYPWYGGHAGQKNDNNVALFNAACMKFLVLNLEYNPGDETLQWANDVVAQHADRRVIVATHEYMGPKGRRPPGEKIFEQLVRKHENIFLVVCGHVGAIAQQVSANDAGGQVHEVLCDYQNLPEGGGGWLQVLRFLPEQNQIVIEAYSPLSDEHADQPKAVATLDYDMSERELAATGSHRWLGRGKLPAGRFGWRIRRLLQSWR
ncbi:MAG: metallophosphoesterase [Pirellulales bacterium]|nr:metallophosphoesterase [Pirellulales bacterium]